MRKYKYSLLILAFFLFSCGETNKEATGAQVSSQTEKTIKEEYKEASCPNLILAKARIHNGGWLFIDTTGKRLTNEFLDLHNFSNGLSGFQVNIDGQKLWGFMDCNFKIIIEPQFREIGYFNEGYCIVIPKNKSENRTNYEIEIIDKKGEIQPRKDYYHRLKCTGSIPVISNGAFLLNGKHYNLEQQEIDPIDNISGFSPKWNLNTQLGFEIRKKVGKMYLVDTGENDVYDMPKVERKRYYDSTWVFRANGEMLFDKVYSNIENYHCADNSCNFKSNTNTNQNVNPTASSESLTSKEVEEFQLAEGKYCFLQIVQEINARDLLQLVVNPNKTVNGSGEISSELAFLSYQVETISSNGNIFSVAVSTEQEDGSITKESQTWTFINNKILVTTENESYELNMVNCKDYL